MNKSFCNQSPNYQCAHAIQSWMRFKCTYTESKMAVAHQYTHTVGYTEPNCDNENKNLAKREERAIYNGKNQQCVIAHESIPCHWTAARKFHFHLHQCELARNVVPGGRTLRENLTQLLLYFVLWSYPILSYLNCQSLA